MGKTTLAVDIAEQFALDQGMPVLIFSMELGAPQLALRMLDGDWRSHIGRLAKDPVRARADPQNLPTGQGLAEEAPNKSPPQRFHSPQPGPQASRRAC